MARLGPALLLVCALVAMAPAVAGLSDRSEEGETVKWRFLSPLAVFFDEGIHVTCLTGTDLRDDPIAVADPVQEHVRFSCESTVGSYCDYPSWTPEPLQDPDLCGDTDQGSSCEGILYDFTGTLRIVPVAEETFEVTYDGMYGGWEIVESYLG